MTVSRFDAKIELVGDVTIEWAFEDGSTESQTIAVDEAGIKVVKRLAYENNRLREQLAASKEANHLLIESIGDQKKEVMQL